MTLRECLAIEFVMVFLAVKGGVWPRQLYRLPDQGGAPSLPRGVRGMSRFAKSTRQPIFSDAEIAAMPLDVLQARAKEYGAWASMYESEAQRMARAAKRRKRAGETPAAMTSEAAA